MPLDHFVSQVHLKQFYSPALGELMYAMRKSDLKTFTPNSESVCRIPDGSTNIYLNESRAIEEFLKTIEPKYNSALRKIESNQIDSECIYTLAGFVAYVSTCSPTAMRTNSVPLESIVKTTAKILDKNGKLPPSPNSLSSSNITELLNNGLLKVKVNEKYPQAIGITSVINLVSSIGNFTWEFLQNTCADSPYFSSDYPIALEINNDHRITNKIVPLSPSLAVRIIPDISQRNDELDLSFNKFQYRYRKPTRQEIRKLNLLIVRCAEDMVFYNNDYPWIKPFITKNRDYHLAMHVDELKTDTGSVLISRKTIDLVK